MVKNFVTWMILEGPPLVLLLDAFIWWRFGVDNTITHIVRAWAAQSPAPEIVYVTGVTILYLHLFRNVL